jgi:hypothetical protein
LIRVSKRIAEVKLAHYGSWNKGEREGDLRLAAPFNPKMSIRALLWATTYTVCAIAVIGLLGSKAIASVKDHRDLAKSDWSVNAIPNLASKPPSKDRVGQFLASLGGDSEDLSSYQFLNLRSSGTLSLVVIGEESRAGEEMLTIVDKTPSGFEMHSILAHHDDDLTERTIKDKAGRLALIVNVSLIDRCMACCWPTFPVIYQWTGAGYTNVSKQFPSFFERKSKTVRKIIDIEADTQAELLANQQSRNFTSAIPVPASSPILPPLATAAPRLFKELASQSNDVCDEACQIANDGIRNGTCREIEAGRIERFLGLHDGGTDYAITLSKSNDFRDRELAAQVFSDVPTGEAVAYLRTLSRDPDKGVAFVATQALHNGGFSVPAEIPLVSLAMDQAPAQ